MKVQHRLLLSPLSPFPQTGSLNVESNITDIQYQHTAGFRVTDRSGLALAESWSFLTAPPGLSLFTASDKV